MANMYQIGKTATKISQRNGKTVITYHTTDIVSFDAKGIVLNTGGWRSNTTKTRMNQTSNVFQLGYMVYQKAGEWFCAYKGQDIPFDQDVLTLER
jgi:hypothetical protein